MPFVQSALVGTQSAAVTTSEEGGCDMRGSICASDEEADDLISSGMDFTKIRGLPNSDSMNRMIVAIIGDQILFRDCLAKCLTARNCLTATFSSLTEWLKAAASHSPPSVALLCSRANTATEIKEELTLLAHTEVDVPIVILSEAGDIDNVPYALDCGVQGYIQGSVTLDVVADALQFVAAGGTFVASKGTNSRRPPLSAPVLTETGASAFTGRELSVLAALQQGKPNKSIAYDLNMSESTVKAHVRNIMRKLKASSRTEVAFLTRQMFVCSA